MRQPPHEQPKVSSAHRLLTSYTHEGLRLDLYGTFDEGGYDVMDIALAGTNVSLCELVPAVFMETLTQWCNDNLPTAAELRKASRDAYRVEHAIWRHELEAA